MLEGRVGACVVLSECLEVRPATHPSPQEPHEPHEPHEPATCEPQRKSARADLEESASEAPVAP